MVYYECEECGQMAPLNDPGTGARHEHCPECGDVTTWTTAFESDQGVSF